MNSFWKNATIYLLISQWLSENNMVKIYFNQSSFHMRLGSVLLSWVHANCWPSWLIFLKQNLTEINRPKEKSIFDCVSKMINSTLHPIYQFCKWEIPQDNSLCSLFSLIVLASVSNRWDFFFNSLKMHLEGWKMDLQVCF